MIEIKITDPRKMTNDQLTALFLYLLACVSSDAQMEIIAGVNTAHNLDFVPAINTEQPRLSAAAEHQLSSELSDAEKTISADTSTSVEHVDLAAAAFGSQPATFETSPAGQAPPPSTSPTIQSAPNVGFDKNGFPWDERIHATAKTKNKDESWRYRRGVDKKLVADVEAEFLAKGYGNASANQTGQTGQPAQVAPTGAPTEKTFIDLIELISEKTSAGLLNTEATNGICQKYGAQNLAQVQQMPVLIKGIYAEIADLGRF